MILPAMGERFQISEYEPGRHITSLDGVRGFAVLLVILFHFFGFGIGWLGVDLFFVLSGFLITGILIDTKNRKNYFTNFYARRTLRIFPLFYFALLLFYILLYLSPDQLLLKDAGYFKENIAWFFLYIQNWLFALKGWPPDHALNHFWSLAIEEQFYLFWPLFVYFLPVRKLACVSVAFIILSLCLRYFSWHAGYTETPVQYTVTFCRLDGLSLGALIAILIRTAPQLLSKIAPWTFIISIPVSIVLYIMAQTVKYDHFLYLTIGYTVFDLFWAGLLILCFTKGFSVIRRFFSTKMMVWLGKYSYGIYVYHWMLHELLMPYYKMHFPSPDAFSVHKYIYGLLCLALTLLISKISYDLFESKVLRLKRFFN